MFDQALDNLYHSFADVEPKKAIRLAIIVGIYYIFRSIYQGYLKKKHLEYQLEMDKKKKLKDGSASEYPSVEAEKEAEQKKEDAKPVPFGFGNKTKKRVKRQERIIKDKYEELKQQQAELAKLNVAGYVDDIADIADLLED